MSNFIYLGHSLIPHSHHVTQVAHHHDEHAHKHHSHHHSEKKSKHEKEHDTSNLFSFFTHNADVLQLEENKLKIEHSGNHNLISEHFFLANESNETLTFSSKKKQKIPKTSGYISPHFSNTGLRAPPCA